ncbi:MAG: class I SAM-dependent methyltransferase [Acidobacteria bacterium]|nr:class I SAM-dependent methyltransferase [Acidobacteriota bacterium]MYH23157.1 class I SAM-dependent methyltransferase [Acidobacteriota bacterium]
MARLSCATLRAPPIRTGPPPRSGGPAADGDCRLMHWGFRYLGKHAAQKVLGGIPSGYRVQELVKRATGRSDRFTAADSLRNRLRSKIERFNAAGIEPPGTVVEQGTGWLGFDLVLFHLAGARRIVTYDTMPWLRADLLRRNAEVLAGSTDIVKRWRGTVPGDVEGRAECLRASLDAPLDILLKRLGVTVRVTRSMDRSEIGAASVDLFYSDSVLQFVDGRDLRALVREARRFLKPSGRCFHVVDCRDSQAQHDRRIPPLAYLAWPEPLWNLLTSRYLNYQNRWRMAEFVALFEGAGFRVSTVNPVARAEEIEYARCRLARVARFRGMSPEEVATRSFWLTGDMG